MPRPITLTKWGSSSFGVDHLLDHAAHARWRVIDRELEVFAHAGELLLLLNGGEEVAVLFEGLPVDACDIGIDLGNADAVIAQVEPEVVRAARRLWSEKVVGEGAEPALFCFFRQLAAGSNRAEIDVGV